MNAEITIEMALAHGLSTEEWEQIEARLGRTPTYTELGVLSVMWSEHCSYKSSRLHLSKFPTTGPRVLQGPGENAGAVDIGNGWAAVFKMESHNHPSFIEPYQGAATGIGGIMRDVFTMGARPIASLDSLRFGEPDHPRTPYLVEGVVGGIAGYGNCMGVPTVGGELYFDESCNGNILVNVFNLGVCRHDEIFRAIASGVGNPVIYVGAKTGRDGMHGATMASAQFDTETEEKRPTVQVGDPFGEKLLLEACLELLADGPVIGIQDMGAAGLTSSSVEMASRGNTGVEIDVDLVPRRESGMNAYECLLSESQERMLVVAEVGREDEVAAVFEKWDLDCEVVGKVTDTGHLVVRESGQIVCDLPIDLLTDDAPCYDRPTAPPAYLDELTPVDIDPARTTNLDAAVLELLGSPNICSRRDIYEQYDHMVGIGTVLTPGQDASVIRLPGDDVAIAVSVDCNSRYCHLNPRLGAQLAAAECARNLSCVGALPLGVTDCLNFGNPEKPGVMWQFVEAVEGLAEACERLETPVVSGNVSFYNETEGEGVRPTPTVAMVGVVEDLPKTGSKISTGFRAVGDVVVMLGETRDELGGSDWALLNGQLGDAPPSLDWRLELSVQSLVRRFIHDGLLSSAHDLSEGGLAVALAESCIQAPENQGVGLGVDLTVETPVLPPATWLFAESASRVLISVSDARLETVLAAASQADVPAQVIGRVSIDRLRWPGHLDLSVAELRSVYEAGLSGIL